jgi:hypothetical protein
MRIFSQGLPRNPALTGGADGRGWRVGLKCESHAPEMWKLWGGVGLVWKNAPMPAKENPPWLFGILAMAYGGENAITTLLIPFLLRRRGVAVNQIADVVAVAFIPNAWYFLWSPVVDLGMLRRHWILLAASVSGLACAVAIGWPPASLAVNGAAVRRQRHLDAALFGLRRGVDRDPTSRAGACQWLVPGGKLGSGHFGWRRDHLARGIHWAEDAGGSVRGIGSIAGAGRAAAL